MLYPGSKGYAAVARQHGAVDRRRPGRLRRPAPGTSIHPGPGGTGGGADALLLARGVVGDWDVRREHVRVFSLRLRAEPVPRIDNREVVAAKFVEPRALSAEGVPPPFIRAHLG